MVLPAVAVVLAALWMISLGLGAEDLAELYVTKIVLDPPSTISRGEEVEVYARVMNTGARSADGFSISFFHRLQGSPGNWTLEDTAEGVSLPPSHQDFYEVTFRLDTSDLDLGTYELRVIADAANHISEADELNNELRTTMTLVDSSLGLPDLQPVSLTYTRSNPGSTDDMEPWNVMTQIRNDGEAQAGQFVVAFYVDGVEFSRQIRFVLPAGGVTDVSAELDPQDPELPLEPGTHDISVVIDPDEEIVEKNEGNNNVTGALTLQSLELVPVSLSFEKAMLRLDEEMTVSSEIRNDGEGVAKAIEVDFYAGHIRFGSATIDILGRGMVAVAEATLDPEKAGLRDAPADYRIRVVIDPNNQLHESDEANNTMSRMLTIHAAELKKPEIHPESIELTPPSPVEQGRGDVVTVTSVIRNTGRAGVEGLDVTFAYRVKGGMRWEPLLCSDSAGCTGVALAAGAQTRLVGQLPVTLLGPGIYEIRVLVDAAGAVDEIDETNNELVTTLTLLASRSPDLTFCASGVTVEPLANIQQGQTVRITACVTNLGEQAAGPFTVRFSYCSAATVGQSIECSDQYESANFSAGPEYEVAGLAIAESIEIPVMLETKDLRPGSYSIRVSIDPADEVQERNELNNTLAGIPLQVLGPDLAVVQLTTSPEGVVDQAEVDELDVVATILNTGVVPIGEFTMRFRLMRMDEQGLIPVQVILCGEAVPAQCESSEHACERMLSGLGVLVPVQVRWTLDLEQSDLPPGQYVLQVAADCEGDVNGDTICDGRIDEHDETNNALEIPLTVLPRPADLVVAGSIEFPQGTPVEYGAMVPIRASIANIGSSMAGGDCSTAPTCGIGVEFLVYETDADSSTGERLLLLTPEDAIASLAPGEATDVMVYLDTRQLDPQITGYRICVRVDPSGSIVELDESNNELCTPPQLEIYPPPPDLQLATPAFGEPAVTFDPPPPVDFASQPVTAHFTVVNDSRSRSQGFNIGFRIRETNVPGAAWIDLETRLPVSGLGPAEELELAVPILLPSHDEAVPAEVRGFIPPGAYEFCVVLDIDGFVEETDEENNTYCTAVGLIVAGEELPGPPLPCPGDCPDLKVRSTSALMMAGDPNMARICATIVNIGAAAAERFTVKAFYYPTDGAEPVMIDDPRHQTEFLDLAPGDTVSYRQDFDVSTLQDGFYDVFVVVDVYNEVIEEDEGNNSKDESLWVR
jgi:subtilase family serine protease